MAAGAGLVVPTASAAPSAETAASAAPSGETAGLVTLHLKFAEGSRVRARGGRAEAPDAGREKRVGAALAEHGAVRVSPLFSRSEAALGRDRASSARAAGGRCATFACTLR